MRIAFPHTNSSSWIDFVGGKGGKKGVGVGRFTNVGSAGAYISGIRFAANKDMNPQDFIKLGLIRICEIERANVPAVDNAVAAITIDKLTASPECVTDNITLPTEGFDGATVVWTSGNPNIIGNDGTFYGCDKATDVVMTAKIENNADKFTVYKDFKLTVMPQKDISISKVFTDSGVKISAKNNTSDTKTFDIIVAVYAQNGALISAAMADVTADGGNTISTTFDGVFDDSILKVFAIDKNMKPLGYALK